MAQFIYGKNVVINRLTLKKDIKKLFLTEKNYHEISKLINPNTKVEKLTSNELTSIVKHTYHQGIIAQIDNYEYFDENKFINELENKENPIVLILDQIQDPQNFGAILRTALAVGVDGVIVEKRNSAPLNSTVAKTSAGAIENVKVVEVSNLNQFIMKLKKIGFWVVSSDGLANTDYREIDYNMPTALVMGSEGNGVRELVKKNSDFLIKIPMINNVNSLNVSVATSVILYEIIKQRFPLK